ncbi:CU044_5270 family protein [Streptomyces sp. NPDC002225]|uniref:CU044_5270 family protein n=1 Tax=Streptomyces sp. NPDC002225 TaxID=3154413 RepID=UPI00331F706C
MDEMTRLREFRADAPAPDRTALAPGRRRLVEAAASGRRPRHPWARRRTVAVVAAAALTVAAVLGTRLWDTAPDRSGPASTTEPLRLTSAAEVLNRAADALERLPVPPEPLDHQWIYTRTTTKSATNGPDGTPGTDSDTSDSWVPYDNSAAAEHGKDTDYRTARQVYRAANALPDDPARLLEGIRRLYPTGHTAENPPEGRAQHSFRAISLVAGTYPISPAALARVYRAMATIPGVRVTDHLVKDAAGREAIAITRKEDVGHDQREILLDPRSFDYLGERFVVAEDYTFVFPGKEGQKPPPMAFKAGQITLSEARVTGAVVDRKGRKP